MPTEESIKFSFTSTAQPDDTFTVAEFEITLYADDPDIDLKGVLKNPVKLTVEKEGEQLRVFHGILSRFEQLHEYSGHVYFRAILVPRLWIADQYLENQLFLDKSVPDIIEEILKQTGLTANDYEMKLTGNYDPWEYICQYNESDFNFISRWMEREGIYYYFEQGDNAEKMIIADAATAHEDIASEESIRYSPPDSLAPSTIEQVREFTCHQQLLPQKVVLKDYNYRKPSLSLQGEADIDPEGRGNVYIYGEHFKTPEQGNALATIRAEELLCREALFYGEGTVPPFLTGYVFELHDHYRDSYNQRYLIIELSHKGVQSTYLTGAGGESTDDSQGPSYFNNFSCIPADTQFRPERLAEKPRLKGTLNGHVDAGGNGEYAEIDDEGRYKIKLPFDQSDSEDGKASRWVRMAQPFAGENYGMHFPLHKGVEVLLTFIDGDPDRPIIAGSVPNPETGSPVTSSNHTQHMISTRYGHNFIMDDINPHWEINTHGGHQLIADDGGHMTGMTMSTTDGHVIDCSDSSGWINIETPSQSEYVTLTDGQQVAMCSGTNYIDIEKAGKIRAHADTEMYGDVGGASNIKMTVGEINIWNRSSYVKVHPADITTETMIANHTTNTLRSITANGLETHTVNGVETHIVNGPRNITVTGPQTRIIASENDFCQAAKSGFTYGAYADMKLAAAFELYAGIKLELKPSVGIEIAGIKIGQTAVNINKDHIECKNGKVVLGEKVLLDLRSIRIFN